MLRPLLHVRAQCRPARRKLLAKNKENAQFEPVVAQLRAIVETIEGEEGSLEESLRAYEEGVGLVRQAQEYLEAAEQRVNLLSEDKPESKPDNEQ